MPDPKKQLVDLPFGGGVDGHKHDLLMKDGGRMEAVEDFVFSKRGALLRRNEYELLGNAGSSVPLDVVAEHAGQVVAIGAEGAYRYGSQARDFFPITHRGPRAMDPVQRSVLRTQEGGECFMSAALGDWVGVLWVDGEDVWLRIDEASSETTLFGPTRLSAFAANGFDVDDCSWNLMVCQGDEFSDATFIVAGRAAASSSSADPVALQAFRVSSGFVATGTPLTLPTGVSAASAETHADITGDEIFIVFHAGATVRLGRATVSFGTITYDASENIASSDSGSVPVACYVNPSASAVYYAFSRSGGTILRVGTTGIGSSLSGVGLSSNLIHTRAATADAGVSRVKFVARPNQTLFVIWGGTVNHTTHGGLITTAVRWAELTSVAALREASGDRILYNCLLHGQPFTDEDGRIFVPLAMYSEGVPPGSSNVEDGYELGVEANGKGNISQRRRVILAELGAWSESTMRAATHYQLDTAEYLLRLSDTYQLDNGERVYANGLYEFTEQDNSISPSRSGNLTSIRVGRHVDVANTNGTLQVASGLLGTLDDQLFSATMDVGPPHIRRFGVHYRNTGNPPSYVGTAQYRLCWVWRDQKGNIHRSAPSEPQVFAFNDGGGGAYPLFQVAIPPFFSHRSMGVRPADVFLEFYCSPAGATTASGGEDGGEIPTAIAENAPDGSHIRGQLATYDGGGAWSGVTQWLALESILDATDPWLSATVIGLRGQGSTALNLYTDAVESGGPGELSNEMPPAPAAMAKTRNRLFIIDSDNRRRVIPSMPISVGSMPRFNPALAISIPTEDGGFVGLGATDDYVFFFGERSIWYMEASEGPDSTGGGAPWSPLRQVSVEETCVNPASIVSTDQGVFYQGRTGMFVVGTGGGIGAEELPEAEELFDGETIVAADVTTKTRCVAWTCTSGRVIVFDYALRAWARHNLSENETNDSQDYVAGCAFQGEHVAVRGPSSVYLSRDLDWWSTEAPYPGFYTYGEEGVDCSFTTPWYQLAGLNGYKRARRIFLLGRFRGHVEDVDLLGTLRMQWAFDGDPNDTETEYIAFSPLLRPLTDPAQWDPFRLRVRFPRQRCSSFRLTVTYTQGGVVGDGGQGPTGRACRWPEWAGLSLEYIGVPQGRRQQVISPGAGS